MQILRLLAMSLPLVAMSVVVARGEEAASNQCIELRVYYAAEGKLDALNARFRDHTCKLFEKHGITNIGYWTPVENPDNKLIYLISFPDRAAREASFKAFGEDPEWKTALAESEKDGKLVTKVESTLMHANDYSPVIDAKAEEPQRVFELRTYIATPNNLDRLNGRFRDHTCGLFERHGMTNLGYWSLDADQADADKLLVYLLAHKSQEARDASFNSFRGDPEWIAARTASEQAGGGSLTEAENGVQSIMLTPTDYSPMK
jgi:hypothetical protein